MDSTIIAALITVLGALFVALIGNSLALIYYAGRMTKGFEDHEARLSGVETTATVTAQDVAHIKGRLEIA